MTKKKKTEAMYWTNLGVTKDDRDAIKKRKAMVKKQEADAKAFRKEINKQIRTREKQLDKIISLLAQLNRARNRKAG